MGSGINIKLVGLGILAALSLGAAFYYEASQEGEAPGALDFSEEAAVAEAADDYTWHFGKEREEAETGVPQTHVFLEAGGDMYDLGVYRGSCTHIAQSGWEILEGELTAAVCYFAGGGSEIGVFEEGGKLLVKVGELDEGSAETSGMRGNFQTLLELN